MNNIEQFSLYTAKIFEVLYEEFPVPVGLDTNGIIAEYLQFYEHEELKKLHLQKDFSEIIEQAGDKELKQKILEKQPRIKENLHVLESKKRDDQYKQESIYDGTLDFLVSEDLIQACPHGGHRLTAKSFSHLNKTFIKGKVESSSYIATIKNIFSQTSSMSKEVAVGIAVNVIPKLLGIN